MNQDDQLPSSILRISTPSLVVTPCRGELRFARESFEGRVIIKSPKGQGVRCLTNRAPLTFVGQAPTLSQQLQTTHANRLLLWNPNGPALADPRMPARSVLAREVNRQVMRAVMQARTPGFGRVSLEWVFSGCFRMVFFSRVFSRRCWNRVFQGWKKIIFFWNSWKPQQPGRDQHWAS